ncbi:MAG: DUF2339 domain-containing protein [Opitutae bacterium]|nr:DUF2339 domain-containing protein [Opitutae bacterium]
MQALLVLLVLYLIAVLVVFPIWAFLRLSGRDEENEKLRRRLDWLEAELPSLRKIASAPRPAAPVATPTPVAPSSPAPAPAKTEPPAPLAPAAPAVVAPAVSIAPPDAADTPPPLLPRPALASSPSPAPSPLEQAAASAPPPVAPSTSVKYPEPSPRGPIWERAGLNLEQFMGAKLFAWLGGLALFLGVAFFVKYSFEHDLIPPEVRVALGFLLGASLIVGGLKLDRERFRITCQTLVATGVVSLYAVTFACNSVYHFAFFGPLATFALMVLITAAAFVLAVRLEAQVVALLGMLAGFLTPILLSTGQDNPPGLFGYLALLDAGLVAVALHRRWLYLVPLGAGGTVLMAIGWADKFYTSEKMLTAATVCLAFNALFFAANEVARRRGIVDRLLSWTAAALPIVALGFGFFFLFESVSTVRAPLFLAHALLADAFLLALAWRDETLPRLHFAAGGLAFLLLATWSAGQLRDAALPWALAAYLVFAGGHTVFPHLLERRRPAAAPDLWCQLFPPLALLLMLIPLNRLDETSFLFWPAILLVDLLAIGLAALSASLLAVGAVLVLTLCATGACLFKIPAGAVLEPSLLLVIGAFTVFFFGAAFWLVRHLGDRLPIVRDGLGGVLGDTRVQLPAFSALLPFVLLIMASARLSVPDPSMLFGLALLLVVLTLGVSRLMLIPWLPACALAGAAALQYAWQAQHFAAPAAIVPLAWHAGFYLLFLAFPFVFARPFAALTGPWAVSALSGVAHFYLVYRWVEVAQPNDVMGLLPAAFAVGPLIALALRANAPASDEAATAARLNQLAWFGGVALLFITLIFPLQFSRQWLTVAWALEGAALCWLFHRMPHAGLRAVGVALLLVAFIRLALNPAVLSYHVRGDTPLFNWYLYAYGLTIVALAAGARLLAPPRDRVLGSSAPPLLTSFAIVLGFLLLNVEIADFFTAPGARVLNFQFRGNFARDMTYTIAWALFALGLLAGGIWKQQRPARYAALGLLSVVLLKLFFHDLARLEALYRVGALFAVAIIAILASFAYQRFLPGNKEPQDTIPGA